MKSTINGSIIRLVASDFEIYEKIYQFLLNDKFCATAKTSVA